MHWAMVVFPAPDAPVSTTKEYTSLKNLSHVSFGGQPILAAAAF